MSENPKELRYSADHEWLDGNTPAKVGITTHAAEQLGDIVYVELPEVGATIKAGEFFGEIESVKSVSDLISPVTGTVNAVNAAVVDDPSLVNQSPFSDGWLISVDVESEGELLSADEYQATLG